LQSDGRKPGHEHWLNNDSAKLRSMLLKFNIFCALWDGSPRSLKILKCENSLFVKFKMADWPQIFSL